MIDGLADYGYFDTGVTFIAGLKCSCFPQEMASRPSEKLPLVAISNL